MSSSSKDEASGSKPSLDAEDKMQESKKVSEQKKVSSAKALETKMKTPPKPVPDIAAIVKKYTSQQAETLKKDLVKNLAVGQEAFANEMKTQFLGLTKMLTSSVANTRQDQLPPVIIPQIPAAKRVSQRG